MTPRTPEHDYTEDALCERPAIDVFRSLDWEIVNAFYEKFGPTGTLGRQTESEVVLLRHLLPALSRLNPEVSQQSITEAADILTRNRSMMSAERANHDVYRLLKDGIKISAKKPDGTEEVETVNLIDWSVPDSNHFLLASQFWVAGELYRRRCDLVGFVNGIPLLFVELKAVQKRLKNAFDENLRDYRYTIPKLFWYNALIILSNGRESKVGSTTAGWEHFSEWKKIADESEPNQLSLETTIRGTSSKTTLLDIVENFTVFKEARGGLIKLVAKYHQYFGVNKAVEAVRHLESNKGRLGVFWHTQGSGKSLSMLCFSQKVLRKLPGNWTFVVITDRDDLDTQLYKEFVACGAVTENETQATSGKDLRRLLAEDHRFVFTLIQKFRAEKGKEYPQLSDRKDIIVMTDEAHRSQYDIFAMNMRCALPNAAFIGFTGTPLMTGEEKTREVFGDYVSIYNFKQSIDDGATVPLYYENRIPEVQLTNDELNDDMEDLLDAAAVNEDEERKLERDFARQYEIITRDGRLEKIAEDIVLHFMGRGVMGKAMVVSIDKVTAVKMYVKVQAYWKKAIHSLENEIATAAPDAREHLRSKLDFMKQTDMAVIVSQSQNEVVDMKDRGVDILPHRKRMVEEDLESKFKDSSDPLRIVFLCAMWLTGFDVPSCNTIYLDKPMKNHSLMQTIARANRVFGEEKRNGVVVDYANIFGNLQRALAIYATSGYPGATGGPVEPPIKKKEELIEALRAAAEDARRFCEQRSVILKDIESATGAAKATLILDAVDILITTENDKIVFLAHAAYVTRLYKAIKPDPAAHEFLSIAIALSVLAETIHSLKDPVDVSQLMHKVEDLLDESTAAAGYIIPAQQNAAGTLVVGEANDEDGRYFLPDHMLDLSQLNFEQLKEKFASCRKHTEIEKMEGLIERRLRAMLNRNRTRMNFQETYQRMLDEYHGGQQSADFHFAKLLELAQKLSAEEARAVAEGLSEEELALFDLLTKPEPSLTKQQEKQVKAIAQDLLKRLKHELLVIDWRARQQSRAAVRLAIEESLDLLPDVYSKELFDDKCDVVYRHVYDSYADAEHSIYEGAA